MRHRRFFAASLLLPLVAVAAHAATVFQDIPNGHWAKRSATVLADAQIMPGRTPVDFAGESPLTRYELAYILSHLYNVQGPPASFIVLSDMPTGHLETQEVQRVIGYGLLATRKPGRFEGDQNVTRKELVEALDTLFSKNGIEPPGRKTALIFSDVKSGTPLALVLDRIVNRFALFDAKNWTPFHPFDPVTRFQTLSMLARAMRYSMPHVFAELNRPVYTPPPASLPPGTSPGPSSPTPEYSLRPFESPPATQQPATTGILTSKAWAQGDLLLAYSESLPTEAGLIVAGEQKQFSGSLLPGGGGAVEYWNGPMGGTLGVSSYYLGLNVPQAGKAAVPVDMLDTFIQGGGYYTIAGESTWQLAVGGVVAVRSTYNISGQLVGQTYLTADKTYFGAGPAVTWGFRPMPKVLFTSGLSVYPLFQTYNLPGGKSPSITRFSALPTLRMEIGLTDQLMLTTGTQLFLSAGGGGMQSLFGANVGFGMGF